MQLKGSPHQWNKFYKSIEMYVCLYRKREAIATEFFIQIWMTFVSSLEVCAVPIFNTKKTQTLFNFSPDVFTAGE